MELPSDLKEQLLKLNSGDKYEYWDYSTGFQVWRCNDMLVVFECVEETYPAYLFTFMHCERSIHDIIKLLDNLT